MHLKTVYKNLLQAYGRQNWWPADTPFEVMVGAVLTQNTSWSNVETAIENLRQANILSASHILDCPIDELAGHIRPSGYFNIKARRLRNLCDWYLQSGGHDKLKYRKTPTLRKELLSINGVGPETADDILLYAFKRKVFVVDAYTRRIFSRIGIVENDIDYENLRNHFETKLKSESVKLFNEYHALIVMHGKDVCKTRPDCSRCCLRKGCSGVEA